MPDLTQRFQTLKKRESELTLQLAGEESSFNTLKSQYQESLKTLLTKYHVNSLEELEALCTKEEKALLAKVQEAESKLSIFDDGGSIDL